MASIPGDAHIASAVVFAADSLKISHCIRSCAFSRRNRTGPAHSVAETK
jgi:hypothetical protein